MAHSPNIQIKLLAYSPATIKYILAYIKYAERKKFYGGLCTVWEEQLSTVVFRNLKKSALRILRIRLTAKKTVKMEPRNSEAATGGKVDILILACSVAHLGCSVAQ